jgi:hypothetical protein
MNALKDGLSGPAHPMKGSQTRKALKESFIPDIVLAPLSTHRITQATCKGQDATTTPLI